MIYKIIYKNIYYTKVFLYKLYCIGIVLTVTFLCYVPVGVVACVVYTYTHILQYIDSLGYIDTLV